MVPENFKPLTDVVNDVVSKFCPTIPHDVVRTKILQEINGQLLPIIYEIDNFVASKPRLKRDVYKFVNDVYVPMSSTTYNRLGICENCFEGIIIGLTNAPINMVELHEIIWPQFVMPVREKIWRLPRVRSRDSSLKVSDQINDLVIIRNELIKLVEEVEKS